MGLLETGGWWTGACECPGSPTCIGRLQEGEEVGGPWTEGVLRPDGAGLRVCYRPSCHGPQGGTIVMVDLVYREVLIVEGIERGS